MNRNLPILRRVLASVLAASLSLTGCGPDSSTPETDASQTAEADITPALTQTDTNSDMNADINPNTIQEPSFSSDEFDQLAAELFRQLTAADYMTWQLLPADQRPDGTAAPEPAFPDLTEYSRQQMELMKSVKFQLGTIEPETLSQPQKDLYQCLSFYADTRLSQEGMASFRILEAFSPTEGIPALLPGKLAGLPFRTRQDVDDYFTLLSDLPRFFKDLALLGQDAARNGLAFSSQWQKDASDACAPYYLNAEYNSLVSSFSGRLDGIPGLTDEERAGYEARNLEAVSNWVIPSYQKLAQDIRQLPVQSQEQDGLCGRENGREYFRCLTAEKTGTSYQDIRLLKAAIEEQLKQNTESIGRLLKENPEAEENTSLSAGLSQDPDQLLSFLQTETLKYFPAVSSPAPDVLIIPDEQADLWTLPGWSCGSGASTGTGVIRIDAATAGQPDRLYQALAETGWPGSGYREAFLKEQGLSPLMNVISFPGWDRGWDTYAASVSFSFENGNTPEAKRLARLTFSSSLAIHALVDIQVNYYGWNQEDVTDFLSQHYSIGEEGIGAALYQKAIYSPADSLAAYTGYLEIRQMKAEAQSALGNAFDEMEFHRFLLETGPAPYALIRSRLKDWILGQKVSKLGK
ncbi:MAG: DUF885 family protein [Lachnospiraceae bacterium]|nr:DUF885 family protein [Lachnospiraceae bacterium]